MDPTYELVSHQIISSNQSSVTFSNIPSSYKDLHIVASTRCTDTTSPFGFDNVYINFNNSISNYSVGVFRNIDGTTSTTSFTNNFIGDCPNNNASANTFGIFDIYIPNYSSSNPKSFSVVNITESNTSIGNDMSQYYVGGLWSNNEPINSIRFTVGSGDSFTASSSFYLYGIKNADDGGRGFFGPAMTGGDEVYTTGNGYKVHVFKNSGTLNVTAPGEVEYLVIGGGGGGGAGNGNSGGGGAGGYRSSVSGENSGGGSSNEKPLTLSTGIYPIVIGAGGTTDLSGSNSSISTITSTGGGRGGGGNGTAFSGGSGGGASSISNGVVSGAVGISGQGFSGGNSSNGQSSSPYAGGGGGGAGASGGNATSTVCGNGGSGVVSSVTGSAVTRAGGGGGGGGTSGVTAGTGGSGGGGNGKANSQTIGDSGTANTGSGGGAGGWTSGLIAAGGNGGSGIVIIRYRI